MMTRKKMVFVVVVVIMLTGATVGWRLRNGNGQTTSFRTNTVTRDDLVVTIEASGTIEPEEVIDVGAQVGGQILSFGIDIDGNSVDYSSHVEQGAVLARIDTALFEADVSQAEAQVESAQAGVQLAEASLRQLKAKFVQAQRDWERAKKLGPSEALAQASYDAYQSAYEVAQADVSVGEATVRQASASLAQAKTGLWRAERNLGYCTITSPVSGVVIARRVNIGQTVVANLDAPSLFLIAQDLAKMQIWVSVNEADIASIHPGQPVSFTVDALPDVRFAGEVMKVRLNASMTQNVVTYTVEISADNNEGLLLPYMTASVEFEVERCDDALLAPSAALRWTPGSVEQVAPDYRDRVTTGDWGEATRTNDQEGYKLAENADGEDFSPGIVWVRDGQYVRPLLVRSGLSNGSLTEVRGKELKENLALVVGEAVIAEAETEDSNPFAPKMPGRPPGGRGPR